MTRLVGLSPAALYRHYRGKDDLLDALAEAGFEILERYLRAVPAVRADRRVFRLGIAYLRFAVEHPSDYEVMFLLPRRKLRRFPSDFERHRSRSFDVLAAAIAKAVNEGRFARDNPLEIGLSIWAHIHGLIEMYRVGRFGSDPRKFELVYRRSLRRLFQGLLNQQGKR